MEKINRKRIKLGYCRITKTSTKFFFDKGGDEYIEFYIDRDPETSMAELWLNPGASDGTLALIRELLDLYAEDVVKKF